MGRELLLLMGSRYVTCLPLEETYAPCASLQVVRKNWMFKLVGSECFKVGSKVAEIAIDSSGMVFEYTLRIDNKSLQKFVEAQAKNTRTWHVTLDNTEHRVVLRT